MKDRIMNSVKKRDKTAQFNIILPIRHLFGMHRASIGVIMTAGLMVILVVFAGCGSKEAVNNEASTSAIRAAEEVGASSVPTASLYLQLAKEELENAKGLATAGEKEKSESMLLRAQADAELAVALSRGDTDKKAAADAVARVQQLRQDNKLSKDGK
jgi:hypothetical protein